MDYQVYQFHKIKDLYYTYVNSFCGIQIEDVPESLCQANLRYFISGPRVQLSDPLLTARINQIQRSNIFLPPDDALNIAETLEATRGALKGDRQVKEANVKILCKNRGIKKCYSFVVDMGSELFYLLLKKSSGFYADGTYKKVRLVIPLSFDTERTFMPIIHKVNKEVKGEDQEKSLKRSEDWFRLWSNDYNVSLRYSCSPMSFFVFRQNTLMGVKAGRLRVFEQYLHCLDELNKFDLSCIERLQCFLGLAKGLLEIYADNRIHGDIKSQNAMWAKNDSSGFVSYWIDFGFSRNFSEPGFTPLCNWYGSIVCTPPELLGKSLPMKEDLLAVEAWAFGFMLFSTMFDPLDWGQDLIDIFIRSKPIEEKEKEIIVEKIKLFLSTQEMILSKYPKATSYEDLRIIAIKLLDVDPRSRMKLEEVKNRLELFLKKKLSEPLLEGTNSI